MRASRSPEREHRHRHPSDRRHRRRRHCCATAIWRCIERRMTAANIFRFYASDMDRRARARPDPRHRFAYGDRQAAIRPALPAADRTRTGQVTGVEALAALAASGARPCRPERIPVTGGRERPHRADQRMGASRGLPRGKIVAAALGIHRPVSASTCRRFNSSSRTSRSGRQDPCRDRA